MPNFSELMKKPAGQSKKPKELIIGVYDAIVKSFEPVAAPAGKDYTGIIRVHVGLMAWPSNATDEDQMQDQGDGTSKPIDLSKRQLRKDFYDNSLYRLDDFIKSCGIDMNGKSYEEVLPMLVGSHVKAEVGQYMNQTTNDIGNQIISLVGTA